MSKVFIAMLLVATTAATAHAGTPFPVEPFPLPFRPVAGTDDLFALRFNPSGLGRTNDVEMGWFHHYTKQGPGGNNAIVLRMKNAAASINWIEDPLRGNRREYMLGIGSPLTPQLFFGTNYRYIKADDSLLQNRHIWTHSVHFAPSPAWSLGARWENPWHTEVGGVKTDGIITAGLQVTPVHNRLEAAMDWVYPEKERLEDTRLVWSAVFHATPGLDVNGFFGTDDRFGVELRIMIDRSAAGNQMRYTSPGGWQDGTFYISILQRNYDHAKIPRRGPVRYSLAP